jgi:hypothetical protein
VYFHHPIYRKDEMQSAEPFPTVIEYAEFDDALPQLLNGSEKLIASIKFMSGFVLL